MARPVNPLGEVRIDSGSLDVAIAERLLGGHIAKAQGWEVALLSGDLETYPVALGLWKGDLTLKRRIVDLLGELESEGKVDEIIGRYIGAAPG